MTDYELRARRVRIDRLGYERCLRRNQDLVAKGMMDYELRKDNEPYDPALACLTCKKPFQRHQFVRKNFTTQDIELVYKCLHCGTERIFGRMSK